LFWRIVCFSRHISILEFKESTIITDNVKDLGSKWFFLTLVSDGLANSRIYNFKMLEVGDIYKSNWEKKPEKLNNFIETLGRNQSF